MATQKASNNISRALQGTGGEDGGQNWGSNTGVWERVTHTSGKPPCQRSLHAAAVWQNYLVIFGGYDGVHRVNDLHAYDFNTGAWDLLSVDAESSSNPSPRDRHIAVVWGNGFYIFGGFDGLTRVNDMHKFDMVRRCWEPVKADGNIPSPRHSHAAVVYKDSLYLFGGYDGSYRCDFHEFDFLSHTWSTVSTNGKVPRSRYRGTCVVHQDLMILHGGHDGTRHLQDTHIFNFTTRQWSEVACSGAPSPRDSHIGVVYGASMYILGGSTGVAMGDFHELDLEKSVWSAVRYQSNNRGGAATPTLGKAQNRDSSNSVDTTAAVEPASGADSSNSEWVRSGSTSASTASLPPPPPTDAARGYPKDMSQEGIGKRFCHIGVVYGSGLFIFGGYDGSNRLNDFQRFQFNPEPNMKSTLVQDMKQLVNKELLSDITFLVEGQKIYGHKLLCLRCPYFNNMFTGEYMESKAPELVIEGLRVEIFLQFLEYLYSDSVDIQLGAAMELFEAADRFGMDRLKKQCEYVMYGAISIDTASEILLAADLHSAEGLRDRCLRFVVSNFDQVSLTKGFHDMSRANLELNLEILQKRMENKSA